MHEDSVFRTIGDLKLITAVSVNLLMNLSCMLFFFHFTAFYIFGSLPILQRPFYERWKMIEKEVIEPRNQERRSMDLHGKPPYRYDLEPFRVRRNHILGL